MGSARINAKEIDKKERKVRRLKKRKGIEAQSVKPTTPYQATDAFIRDEEQNGKHENKKKETGSFSQPSYPGPFSHLLRRARIIQ